VSFGPQFCIGERRQRAASTEKPIIWAYYVKVIIPQNRSLGINSGQHPLHVPFKDLVKSILPHCDYIFETACVSSQGAPSSR
jgi:hypothetical protein